jgi:hypothetical protein
MAATLGLSAFYHDNSAARKERFSRRGAWRTGSGSRRIEARGLRIPPRPPIKNQLRYFGWLLSLVLAVAARVAPAPFALGMQTAAATVFAVATIWPASMRPLAGLFISLTPQPRALK